jgi:tetratricopeptide (TPR) repeat protein
MIETMAKIEQLFGLTYKDIDRYVRMVAVGDERHDNNMVIKYGEKVMQIQKESSSHAQSPYIEFTLYQAYIEKEDYNKALDIIKSLDNIKLNNNQRARQKYLLGSVYSKLWRDLEAKQAYEESIKADANSAWAKLAKSAKEI